MAGLLGSMLAGGVKSVADGRLKDIEQKEKFDYQNALMNAQAEKELMLKKAGIEMETQRDIAKETRTRDTNKNDMEAIRSRSESTLANDSISKLGVGGSVDAESLQALKDNPQALEAYKKAGATGLLNSNRQQQAEADTSSALAIGRTDFAEKFESVAKGERADAKETSRHEESMKKLDLTEKNNQQRFMTQMAQNSRIAAGQEARLSKSESSAEVRAKVSAMSSALDSYKDVGEKAMLKLSSPDVMNDPALSKKYSDIAEDSLANSNRIAKQLENYSFTGSFEQPKQSTKPTIALDDIFGDKAAVEQPKPSKKQADEVAGNKNKPASNKPVENMWSKKKGSLDDVDKDRLNFGEYGVKK